MYAKEAEEHVRDKKNKLHKMSKAYKEIKVYKPRRYVRGKIT